MKLNLHLQIISIVLLLKKTLISFGLRQQQLCIYVSVFPDQLFVLWQEEGAEHGQPALLICQHGLIPPSSSVTSLLANRKEEGTGFLEVGGMSAMVVSPCF